jgi:ABC-type transport system involved in cytochrome bd biosynthesis fused ATPase/permease subunit
MVQAVIIIVFIILVRKGIKDEQREYKEKYGMTKSQFLAMRKRMNPEFKITLKQWLQDLSKN